MAYDTDIPIVIEKVHKYLVAPNYDYYKDIRRNSFRDKSLRKPW